MNIILLAPPVAGKGTQAEMLIEKYQLKQISTGDLFRKIASEDNPQGNQMKELLASGELISDELTLQVLEDYLANNHHANGYIFDGFPRNINQAEALDSLLSKSNQKVDYTILLDVPKAELLKRISGRRICKSCGAIYNVNVDSLKPNKDSICNKCGDDLYQRNDDNETAFDVRYNNYLTKTKSLIDYYLTQKKLYSVDASINKETTFSQIELIIEKR